MIKRKDTQSATGKFARALLRDRKGTIGAILLLFFVVLAVFPGQIAPYNPAYIGFPRIASDRRRFTGSARPPRARTSTRSSSGARARRSSSPWRRGGWPP